MRERRQIASAALGIYLLFLAFILLAPSAEVPSQSVLLLGRVAARLDVPAVFTSGSRVEFVCNVIIIAPVSLLGSVNYPRFNWRDWTVAGFLLAGSVEVAQAVFLPGRSASFEDVVANSLGAAFGAVLYRLGRKTLQGFAPRSCGNRCEQGPFDP